MYDEFLPLPKLLLSRCFLDLKIGIVLATGDGEIIRIGFQHERDTVGQPLALAEAHKGVAESLAKAECSDMS